MAVNCLSWSQSESIHDMTQMLRNQGLLVVIFLHLRLIANSNVLFSILNPATRTQDTGRLHNPCMGIAITPQIARLTMSQHSFSFFRIPILYVKKPVGN